MPTAAATRTGMGRVKYRYYLLTLLLVILALNTVDRLAIGLVLQNIKVDLHLSDTELGFLTGIAFAMFYSVVGIPIARWADHGNRATIIWLTTAFWSVMVALCGAVSTFVQLLLVRVCVAVGEAGCIPPAHSLIAGYFNRLERPRAVALYMLGPPLSGILGYFFAGWVNQYYGWRITFVVLGAPGLALAALAWWTLREPRRESRAAHVVKGTDLGADGNRGDGSNPARHPRLKEVCVDLWANRTFRRLLACFSVVSFFGYGIMQWQPAFLIRSYGLKTGELGTWLSLIYGVGGLAGTYVGGELATRQGANNERAQLLAMAGVYAAFGLLSAWMYLTHSRYLAFGLMAIGAFGGAMTTGPILALIQTLVQPSMRATSIAIIYLCANLIGMGLGPLAAGILSDSLRPWFGDESLRYSLLSLCPGYLVAGWFLWRASGSVKRDLEAVQRFDLTTPVPGLS